jgi:serine/threonine-protein kinase
MPEVRGLLEAPDNGAQAGRTIASSMGRAARWIIAVLAVLVAGEALVIGRLLNRPTQTVAAAFPFSVESTQPGVDVLVDGKRAGATPLKLNVSTGPHAIRFVTADADAATRALTSGLAAMGTLDINSEPAGARVTVDGTRRGTTPLSIAVPQGQHTVVIADGASSSSRTITVGGGSTASIVATLGPAGGAAGWLTIAVPIELQVLEAGAVVGTTSAARLMLPAGHHDLELSNAALGFRTTIGVEVQPGKTSTSTVAVPNGSISINALPWANVWLDGRSLGTTPIANLDVPLGNHEVIWRHPQLGERRQSIVVTAKAPLRLVMDLNKK